jgi:alginate O-acetyltransferase complex protein AlgI
MLFNSYVFLVFLPIVWAIYFILNKLKRFRAAQCALIASSFFFYGYYDYKLCLLLGFSILVNYLLHLGLTNSACGAMVRRLLLTTGLLVNLGLLFYFKYLDFTLNNLNRMIGTDFALRYIVLPLGISFYTFQQISFVADSYQRKTGRCNFLSYSLFVSFFPQLVAGPIVLYSEVIPQFDMPEKRKVDYGNILSGMEYFIIGLAKKVLIADTFARICDAGYLHLHELNRISAIFTIIAFSLQIYFDFSGYCDMAMGIAKLFNIDLPVNFDSPYKAVNISDFWKKWHITLTRFLTNYLYIPLGGNRKNIWRTCINVMIVFTVSGLWHGAAWTFVLWGMLHGVAMVIWRLGRKVFGRLPKWLLWVLTFGFVNVAWTFFRAEYFRQPWHLFTRIIAGGWDGIHPDMLDALYNGSVLGVTLDRLVPLAIAQPLMQILFAGYFVLWTFVCARCPSSHETIRKKDSRTGYFIWLALLFTLSFMALSQVSKFIYFNF